jgi:hypothetical protein
MLKPVGPRQAPHELIVVENWQEELTRLVPAN